MIEIDLSEISKYLYIKNNIHHGNPKDAGQCNMS